MSTTLPPEALEALRKLNRYECGYCLEALAPKGRFILVTQTPYNMGPPSNLPASVDPATTVPFCNTNCFLHSMLRSIFHTSAATLASYLTSILHNALLYRRDALDIAINEFDGKILIANEEVSH